METFTLDHNALIHVETGAPLAAALRGLVALHDRGMISVQLVAVGASEKLRDKSRARDYSVFEQRLVRLGLAHLPVLLPLGVWGVTYWGHFLWGDGDGPMEQLCNQLMQIMAPATRQLTEKNQCDILSMWTHIYNHGDAFVTTDYDDFLRPHRKHLLQNLGAGSILAPVNALARAQRSPNP